MKTLAIVFLVLLSSTVNASLNAKTSNSAQYLCTSDKGDSAHLLISGNAMIWSDETHAASSTAKFLKIESAPFSLEKGFLVYILNDFYKTEDSCFFIKIEAKFNLKKKFRIVEGFYNDDFEEGETQFNCNLIAKKLNSAQN